MYREDQTPPKARSISKAGRATYVTMVGSKLPIVDTVFFTIRRRDENDCDGDGDSPESILRSERRQGAV